MDSIRPAGTTIDLQKASQILEEQQEAIKSTSAQIAVMEKERDSVQLLEGLNKKERIKKAPGLYNECYAQRYKDSGIKSIEMGIWGTCTAAFFIGAATGGMSGLVFLPLCITSLFGPAIAKSVLLSDGKIDALMQEKLKERPEQLERGISSARKHLEEIKTRILEKAAAQGANPAPGAEMDDEENVLIIDDCKLKKKHEGAMEFLPAFMKFNKHESKP